MPNSTKKNNKNNQLTTQLFAQIKKKRKYSYENSTSNLELSSYFPWLKKPAEGILLNKKYLYIKKSESATFHSVSRSWNVVNKIALEKNLGGSN